MLDKMKALEIKVNEAMRSRWDDRVIFEDYKLYYRMQKLYDEVKQVLYEVDTLPEEVRKSMDIYSQHERLQELLFKIAKELRQYLS